MNTSRIEIDLGAIDHNVRTLRACARAGARAQGVDERSIRFCGVIKQDAYGTGAARVARRLAGLNSAGASSGGGVDMLAVYCLTEARALVETPMSTPVLVLMPVSGFDRNDPLYRLAVRDRLHLVVHSVEHAHQLIDLGAKLGLTLPVHLQVDVGMSRGGCLPDEATALLELIASSPRLTLAGLMTHFSSPGSDATFTREQAHLFRSWIDSIKPRLAAIARERSAKGLSPVTVHLANTCATLRSHTLHGTMVRVGQGMLGYGPEAFSEDDAPEFQAAAAQLRPAVRWLSRVVHLHTIPAGWPVGYDRTFVARRPSVIAVVPAGYADGYPRLLGNRAYVRLTGLSAERARTSGPLDDLAPETGRPGVFAPVVGRVSMDQLTIDVTDVPEALRAVGMEVELVGTDPQAPNHLPLLAALAETITHEMLCRVSPHLERTYVASAPLPAPAEDAPIEFPPHVQQLRALAESADSPIARVSPVQAGAVMRPARAAGA